MTSFERITTTFTRGELSPRILGRVDFEGRFDGVEKLENFLVHVQGGAQKRSGTRFVAPAAVNGQVRLIPFEVSVEQTYIIEATDLTFRFYANEGRVEDPPGTPVETVSPFTSAELPFIKWTQSADVLFMAHDTDRPIEVRRTSPTSFSTTIYDNRDGPYLRINNTPTTLTLSATTGTVTVTASSTTGINDDQGFLSTDVGRVFRFRDTTMSLEWTWLKITAFTNSTTVTADIFGPDPDDVGPTTAWRLGAWSDTTGWPQVVIFHQQRLWWGRTRTQPQTVWASEAFEFNNFAPTDFDGVTTEAHAITLTIDSNQVNAIAWMLSTQKGLQIGTVGEEWLIRSADNTTGISASNAELVPQGSWGSDDTILPVRVGNSTIYVQRGSTVVRESAFSFDEDAYTANNITILSEHLFRRGVKRLASVQTPIQTVWALLEDGTLAGFTFDKEQKVLAWHHHTIAGTEGGPAEIIDIATIKETGQDQLWLVVKREIDNDDQYYIEFMEEPFDTRLHTVEEAFYVDSGLTYSGVPATSIFGLERLEGETVAVLADGAVQANKQVSSGEITLDTAASEVHVGLPFTSEIVTMPIEAPTREGQFVTIGKTKRIHQTMLLLAETVGVKAGQLGGKIDEILFRKPSMSMDQPVPLFDGIKQLSLTSSWEQQARLQILSDTPLPCSVLAISAESEIHGS